MKKDPKIFLKHILESIEDVEDYINDISKKKFSEDIKTQDAVIRKLEIIGEAVKNLPNDFRKLHTEIEWREISGMRDRLIHEYFDVNIDIVWGTAKKDIPEFKKQVLELLEEF